MAEPCHRRCAEIPPLSGQAMVVPTGCGRRALPHQLQFWARGLGQRKSPAKRRAGPAFGYAGDGLPSRCIRRYRLPSRCTRKKFHARPEQGNGPAADGASFSLTLKFIGVRKEPLFPSGTKTIRGLGNRSARFHHPHHRKRSHRWHIRWLSRRSPPRNRP
jgi:hypothetical protein